MKLLVKRLSAHAILPSYAHPGDAGLDLYAAVAVSLEPGESKLVGTGISIELPPNTEAQVRPRSGLALKHGITVLNTPGTIDHGYRGEVGVILINHGRARFDVQPGMKIAQMVIASCLTRQRGRKRRAERHGAWAGRLRIDGSVTRRGRPDERAVFDHHRSAEARPRRDPCVPEPIVLGRGDSEGDGGEGDGELAVLRVVRRRPARSGSRGWSPIAPPTRTSATCTCSNRTAGMASASG